VYSVISPESCASIIYRDSGKAEQAAAALRLTAEDLLRLELIDEVVPEPEGGAQENPDLAADSLRNVLRRHLGHLATLSGDELVQHRYLKFRRMGNFFA
jgi:acetyl-CoA carboxylase carboxyl transferase subunit alpha